jgi:hypothetical protein
MPLMEAHILKVEQEIGSEWAKIHTDHATVKTLGTKRPDLIREAAEFKQSGDLVEIDFAEQTKTVQTEGGPRTYHNYYFNGAGSLASQPEIPGVDMVAPQARAEDPDRNWRICLQTGGKLAVSTLPLMPVDQRDFETQKTIAQAWAEFFFFTPRPTSMGPRSVLAAVIPIGGDAASGAGYEQPPVDDDIPF